MMANLSNTKKEQLNPGKEKFSATFSGPTSRAAYLESAVRPRSLREAILLTLAFFDAQDIAPTIFEVRQNLMFWRASYLEVWRALESDALIKKNLTCRDGFLSLRGEEQIFRRQESIKICESLFKVARRTARWICFLPFVSSISVVNNVASGSAGPKSDIDFFVTARPDFLWLGRALTTGLVQILGRRKHGNRHAGRVCLSFFAADNSLAFEKYSIADGDDYYLAFWLKNIAPLNSGISGPRFDVLRALAQNNTWSDEIFPQCTQRLPSERRQVSRRLLRVARPTKKIMEKILLLGPGLWLEKKIRAWQLKHMKKNVPFEHKTRTAHVVISDEVLKFHEEDRRTWFKEKTLVTFAKLKKGESLKPESLPKPMPGLSHAGLFVQPVGETVAH